VAANPTHYYRAHPWCMACHFVTCYDLCGQSNLVGPIGGR
jgi:hypothetical protein